MRVNDLLRMELIAECLGKQPAFLVQERPWSPSSSTILPQWHFALSEILAPVRRAMINKVNQQQIIRSKTKSIRRVEKYTD